MHRQDVTHHPIFLAKEKTVLKNLQNKLKIMTN